jgi:hypothetical protein
MKTFVLVGISATFLLTSCAGGWKDKEKKMMVDKCVEGFMEGFLSNVDVDPAKIKAKVTEGCECVLEKQMEKYPKAKDYQYNKEEHVKWMDECFDIDGIIELAE